MLAGESPFAARVAAGRGAARDARAADGARDASRRRAVVPRCRGAAGAGEAAGRPVPERGGVRGGARRAARTRRQRTPDRARRADAWCPRARRCTPPARCSPSVSWAAGRSPLVTRGQRWIGAAPTPVRSCGRRRRARRQSGQGRATAVAHRGRPRRSLAAHDRRRTVRGRRASRPTGAAWRTARSAAVASTSDLWVTDLDAGTTRRLTDDDARQQRPAVERGRRDRRVLGERSGREGPA